LFRPKLTAQIIISHTSSRDWPFTVGSDYSDDTKKGSDYIVGGKKGKDYSEAGNKGSDYSDDGSTGSDYKKGSEELEVAGKKESSEEKGTSKKDKKGQDYGRNI
jgi:hypothetical protein